MNKPLSRRTQAGLAEIEADEQRRKASRAPSKLSRQQRLLLKALEGGPAMPAALLRVVAPGYLHKLTEEKRVIRASVTRSLRNLEKRGLAVRTDAGWAATVSGRYWTSLL